MINVWRKCFRAREKGVFLRAVLSLRNFLCCRRHNELVNFLFREERAQNCFLLRGAQLSFNVAVRGRTLNWPMRKS